MSRPANPTPATHSNNSQVRVDRPRATDIHGKIGTVTRRSGSLHEVQIGDFTFTLHGDSLLSVG